MPDALRALRATCAAQGVFLDTNILLILLAGLWDRDLVEELPRNNRGYTARDFDLLASLIGGSRHVWTTPHVLAEVSNLSNELSFKRKQRDAALHLARVVAFLRQTREELVPKDTILSDQSLALLGRIGVADLSIIETARKHKCPVLTDDARFEADLLRQNIVVFNFTHIRFLAQG